ncbi:MAG: sugar kinase [Chitinophagales bacterium]|nr:MAG: sugar kinase [Chitinophagales bacterium]
MSLLVVGTVAFDSIETPFGKSEKIIGGAATYICWSASYFIKDIRLVSVIGDDFPRQEIQELTARGVNVEGLQIRQGHKSFFWAGKYHLDMNTRTTLATELNVLADFDPVLPESYKTSEFLMLGNLTPQVQIRVIEQMQRRPRLVVMDTMNYWMDTQRDTLLKVLKKVDVLAINDEEARQLSQEYSLIKAARKILRMGPRYLVIKKGENGALLFHENQVFFAPAIPLEEVFDPTGAGDTFAGGFIGHIANTRDISFDNMKRAVIFGSAMASFCVEKFGLARLKEITREELDERVQEFIDLVQFDISLEE